MSIVIDKKFADAGIIQLGEQPERQPMLFTRTLIVFIFTQNFTSSRKPESAGKWI